MKLYRIIDKQGYFIRDDFTWAEDEIGLDVVASQGLYQPLWNGSEWVEGASEIPTQEVVEVEKDLEQRVVSIEEKLDVLFGGNV
jgi:hypothetical protein